MTVAPLPSAVSHTRSPAAAVKGASVRSHDSTPPAGSVALHSTPAPDGPLRRTRRVHAAADTDAAIRATCSRLRTPGLPATDGAPASHRSTAAAKQHRRQQTNQPLWRGERARDFGAFVVGWGWGWSCLSCGGHGSFSVWLARLTCGRMRLRMVASAVDDGHAGSPRLHSRTGAVDRHDNRHAVQPAQVNLGA